MNLNHIKGITSDSRAVKSGYLFAALPGATHDGRDFIGAAIANGATHILAPTETDIPNSVTPIYDDNPRRKLAELASELHTQQPENIYAVTGTNGKTSTAIFVQQLLEMTGHKSVSLGTTGIHGSGINIDGTMTTPDPVAFHQTLSDLSAENVTHLAIEASSHGLDQYRLHGISVKAAGYTNLSQDHLDYHPDMDAYFQAKLKLFSDLLADDGVASLNADTPEYSTIRKQCKHVTSYGEKGDDLTIKSLTPTAHGQELVLYAGGQTHTFHFPLVGHFQVMNALCALGMVAGIEKDFAPYIPLLEKLKGVPGRLQPVLGHPNNAGVYIDYAHTPDALDNVLRSVRPHTQNRLICIAGCGGDRDKTKRPIMGRIASDLADHLVIADDNPRSEDPASIRADMIKGVTRDNYTEADDRRKAIHDTIATLKDGDVLVIAGKGHETGQEFADHIDPLNDYEEAVKAIGALK